MPSAQELVAQLYGHVAAGDMVAAEAMIHPEFRGEEAAGLPHAGIYEGVAGWHRLLETVMSVFSEFVPSVEYLLADDTGTRVAAMVGLKVRSAATGERAETSLLELWEVRDGLIKAVKPYYWDTHLLRTLCGQG